MTVGILNLDASISMYHEALRYVSYSLSKQGIEVVHLGCNSALQRCININSQPEFWKSGEVDILKKNLCPSCQLQQNKLKRQRSFAVSPDLDSLNTEQENILKEINTVLARDPRGANIIDFKYKDIEFCKIAFFDYCTAGKLSDLSVLDDEEISRLMQHIRDSLLMQNFFERIGRECRFDKIIYVNGNYSHNTLARALLKNNCREFLSLEFQFSSYKSWNRIFFEKDRIALISKWPAISLLESSYKLKKNDIKCALRIMENRFMGNDFNSYTRPGAKSGYAEFDAFRSKYKTVISYFLSSTDELYSHIITHGTKIDNTYYASQYELLGDFIKNANADIGYVIRVHPRLAPNKRDSVMSRELVEIREYLDLAGTKDNFFIIEADNPLSSYYVILRSDLVVVSWSTIALEALVAGKPVFALFPSDCMFPIKELCSQPVDVSEYRRIINGERALSEYKIDDIKLMKWISMVYNALSKPVPSPRGSRVTVRGMIYDFLYYRLIARDWIYELFMSFFSSDVITGMITGEKPSDGISGEQDDIMGGLQELKCFRQKIRDIILR